MLTYIIKYVLLYMNNAIEQLRIYVGAEIGEFIWLHRFINLNLDFSHY